MWTLLFFSFLCCFSSAQTGAVVAVLVNRWFYQFNFFEADTVEEDRVPEPETGTETVYATRSFLLIIMFVWRGCQRIKNRAERTGWHKQSQR